MKRTAKQISLAEASAGRVRVSGIAGGADIQGRLAGIGIIPRCELEIVKNERRGPIVVRVGQSRIALGRGVAEKIIVEFVTDGTAVD